MNEADARQRTFDTRIDRTLTHPLVIALLEDHLTGIRAASSAKCVSANVLGKTSSARCATLFTEVFVAYRATQMPFHKPKATRAPFALPSYCAGGRTSRETLAPERIRQFKAVAVRKFPRELVKGRIRLGGHLS
jgi:hypothetical protein